MNNNRVLPIIFMIDTSESMTGERIAKLNEVMHDALNILTEKAEEYVESEIKISVLKYSNGCEWVTKGLVGVGDFQWKDLNIGRMTDLGAAIRELDSMLSRSAFFDGVSRYYAPIIINITDSIPTDNWEKEFKLIKKNKWFNISKKICITIGNNTNTDVLEKFCGTKEAVIRAEDISVLRTLIASISVSASMFSDSSVPPKNEWNEKSWGVNPITTTMALQSQCGTNDDSEWDNGSWTVDSFAASGMIPTNKDNDVEQRRLRLAEALRNGQNVLVDTDGNVVTNSDSNDSKGFEGIVVPSGRLAGGMPNRCRVCDNAVFSDAKFCPYCGTKIAIEKPVVQMSRVGFSAVAPKQLVKGEYSIIDVVMYEESYRHIVDEIRKQADSETQEKKSGKVKVQEEANIKVILSSNDIEVDDNETTGVWQGSYLCFSFPVYLPENYKKRQVLFTMKHNFPGSQKKRRLPLSN